jgi:hypothetical protein
MNTSPESQGTPEKSGNSGVIQANELLQSRQDYESKKAAAHTEIGRTLTNIDRDFDNEMRQYGRVRQETIDRILDAAVGQAPAERKSQVEQDTFLMMLGHPGIHQDAKFGMLSRIAQLRAEQQS